VDFCAQARNCRGGISGNGANSNLHRRTNLNDAPHGAGAAIGISLVFVAQAGVRADLEHAEIREFLGDGGNERRSKRAFAAKCDGEFRVVEKSACCSKNFGDYFVERAVHSIDGRQSVDANFLVWLQLEFFIVEADAAASASTMKNSSWSHTRKLASTLCRPSILWTARSTK